MRPAQIFTSNTLVTLVGYHDYDFNLPKPLVTQSACLALKCVHRTDMLQLISDPWQGDYNLRIQQSYQYTRLFGNIGKPGLALITCPSALMIRSASLGSWRMYNYAEFDGQILDAFTKTSLHLNVLEWSSPLQGNQADGQLTSEANLVQAVISIHDRGVWVGDIDITSALSHSTVVFSEAECRPTAAKHTSFGDRAIWADQPNALPTHFGQSGLAATEKPGVAEKHKPGLLKAISMCSVDYWDETLDLSRDNPVLVVRCHGNWLARLGTLGVLTERSAVERIIVCPQASEQICWRCLMGIEDNDESKAMGRVICIL